MTRGGSGRGRIPHRITAVAAVLLALAVALAAGSPATRAAAADPAGGDGMPGTASATAQALKLNPTFASLSLGITVGFSAADYTNRVARAESRALDLGQIGATLAAEGCDGGNPTLPADQQPQPLRTDSRDPKAAQGYSEQEAWAPIITKSVRASSAPDGEAETSAVALGDGRTVSVIGAGSRAQAHVVDGATREALGTADVAGLDLAGLVQMRGLRWEAVHRSGRQAHAEGRFSIGSLTIGGASVPTSDPSTAFAAANAVLAPVGIQLVAPKVRVAEGVVSVDPLAIAVVPSATRDGITRPVLEAAYPLRKALADALLQASCSTASFLTIADLLVGSVTGSGSFALQLGGVQATSGVVRTTSFLRPLPAPAPDVAPLGVGTRDLANPVLAPRATTSATPAPEGAPVRSNPPAVAPRAAAVALPAARTAGERGGALAVVGLTGLLLMLSAAEADRRLLRRWQRTIPLED